MKTTIQTRPDGKSPPRLPTPSPVQESITPISFIPEICVKAKSLPSQGLAYPKNCTIKYRPYTFGEIKKLSQSKLVGKEKFESILSGIECSFDKHELTASDLMFLSFLRRISTFGTEKITIAIECSKCRKPYKEELELGADNSKIEFYDIKAPSLPARVTLSNQVEYAFNPLTIKKLYEILEHGDDVSDDLVLLSYMCENHPQKEALKIIQDVTRMDDRDALESIDFYLMHGLKPVILKCKNKIGLETCNQESIVELDGGEALLLPFRQHEKSPRDRIRFGIEASH